MHLQTNRIIQHLTHFHRHAPPEAPRVEENKKERRWMKAAAIIIPVVTAAAGFVAGTYFPGRQNWEYTFTKMENPRDLVTVYEMGEEGWLVAGSYKDHHGMQMFLLQRPYKPSRLFKPAMTEE